jgi:hypothetical protein
MVDNYEDRAVGKESDVRFIPKMTFVRPISVWN